MKRMVRGSKEFETVSRVYGVKPEDSPIEGAEKALAVAISVFGKDHPQIKKAIKMVEAAKARGIK